MPWPQSLTRALQHAPAHELLRFAHRRQALLTFVADALQGSDRRDWAWQQLSLLPATRERRNSAAQRHQALLRLLADDAQESVPLLRVLLHSATWRILIARLEDAELRGLAQSVLARLAGPTAQGFAPGAHESWMTTSNATAAERSAATAPEWLPTAPPWLQTTAAAASSPQRMCWALRLVCLLTSPSLAARGASAVDAQLREWRMPAVGAAPGRAPASEAEPAARSESVASSAAPSTATQPLDRTKPAPDAANARAEASTLGHTEHGGLLFLLPLLPPCGALALLQDPGVWPPGSLPQALHRLALQLWPMAEDDAAALAFGGLPPDSPPPTPALPSTPAQAGALLEAKQLLLAHLAQRLPDWRGPVLLSRVLRRSAVISADPGWIDVVLQLRDVSLELRRAALDLDPGFLPWLGIVLRYRYE